MTALRRLTSLTDIAHEFDAIVFDQWGVLHNGTTAYPGAIAAVKRLAGGTAQLAVLSNSGKRSEPNRKRIAAMGFPAAAFAVVMTSGEALWLDVQAGRHSGTQRLFPICAAPGDAEIWRSGIAGLSLVTEISDADAILLMGLPEDARAQEAFLPALDHALRRKLPLFCSNPDKASPRSGGCLVRSPGALAEGYAQAGGEVFYYGKPYPAVFESLQRQLSRIDPARMLMIGDSIEHDIAGAAAAGWRTLFIEGGLHAGELRSEANRQETIGEICRKHQSPLPDFHMEHVA